MAFKEQYKLKPLRKAIFSLLVCTKREKNEFCTMKSSLRVSFNNFNIILYWKVFAMKTKNMKLIILSVMLLNK